jgi:apolipoprotein N-acyltransferase
MAASRSRMEPSTPTLRKQPAVRPQPKAAPVLPMPCLLPATVSGSLLWMCFHPLSWGWLAWVALVPLLFLVRSTSRPRRIYLSAWAGGIVLFVAALQWLRAADQWMPFPKYPMHAAWLALAVYCSLYFPLAIYLTRVLERRTRLPLVVTFPAVWVALEYVRAFMLTGFPWYYLAHSQHEFLTIIQIADLGGAFAVSLLVAAVNALAFDVVYQVPQVRAFFRLQEPNARHRTFGDDWPELGGSFFFASWRRGILVDLFVVIALLGAAYLYGDFRLQQPPSLPGPRVAILQGNLDIRLRNEAHQANVDPKLRQKLDEVRFKELMMAIGSHYERLCKYAEHYAATDLFIWPETSYPQPWFEVTRDLPLSDVPELWQFWEETSRKGMRDALAPLKTPQLVGVNTRFFDRDKKLRLHNSALLLNSHGSALARYDKMHGVPFGEYVPLRDWLPFMNWFAPYDFDYSIRPGEAFTRFTVEAADKEYRFGVLICYEDTDPFLAPHYARNENDGKPVDFLVNISNDGWFDGTSEHDEHLAVSRFRAVECRRALVRSVNMGISAVIDGDGRVLKPELANKGDEVPVWAIHGDSARVDALPHDEWGTFRKVAGVLIAWVPIDNRYSFYAHYGDWLAGLCWLLILAGTLGMWVFRRFRPVPPS